MEWKYKYELVMVAPGGKQHPQLVHTHTHSAYITDSPGSAPSNMTHMNK